MNSNKYGILKLMSVIRWANFKSLHDISIDEQEPYAMPIIVRVEKNADMIPSHEEAQLAVAKAVALFFDSAKIVAGGEWKPQVDKWLDGRIRKVARRARGKEWEAVKALDGIYATHGKAEVIILPPHLNFEPPAEIKKLQVSGLDLPKDSQEHNIHAGLEFTVNPDLLMSTGKSLAQIGHAVQLAIFNSNEETLTSWRANNMPVNICGWNEHDEWTAEIRDAGFTEIPKNSLTAKSIMHY